jgi:hypothetical protein
MPTVPTDQHLYDNYRSFPGLGPEETYPGEGRNPLGYYSKADTRSDDEDVDITPYRKPTPPAPPVSEKEPIPSKAPRDRYSRISEVTL